MSTHPNAPTAAGAPSDLTARYVFSAAQRVPRAQRPEFARELAERIRDDIDARIDSGASTSDAAEHDALAALGNPALLAVEYADRPPMLIGPRWYDTWKRILILVEIIVVPTVAGAWVLSQFISGDANPGLIGSTWGISVLVATSAAFWVTLVFALIDRAPAAEVEVAEWTPADLRDLPAEPRSDRRMLLIGSLFWLVVLVGFLVWQQLAPSPGGDADGILPVFDPALWSSWMPYYLVLFALEAARTVWMYRVGYTWPIAAVTIALNLALGVPAIWLTVSGQLFAPGFEALFEANLDAAAQQVLPILLIATIVGGVIANSVLFAVRAARASRQRSLGADWSS
ncbi:hypothetical protein [Agromyces sp. LHK192]|uniref:hypothetical protein n=1 Tax=Agromyces sp. LHK192 TaxID=2498704 RepID=UPI000FDABCBA|nr:hypothetical protein [Agromyces sp. LHK192]